MRHAIGTIGGLRPEILSHCILPFLTARRFPPAGSKNANQNKN